MKVMLSESQLRGVIRECIMDELGRKGLLREGYDCFFGSFCWEDVEDYLGKNGIFMYDEEGNDTKDWKMIEQYMHKYFEYDIRFDAVYEPDEWHSEVAAYEPGGYSVGKMEEDDGLKKDMMRIPDAELREKLLGCYDGLIEIAKEKAGDVY
jgi:hypothetical protein